MNPNVLFIDPWDFESDKTGGIYSFSRELLGALGNRLALVGVSNDDTPVGRWVERDIAGQRYSFFGIRHADSVEKAKPLIPYKVSGYCHLRRHMRAIRACGIGTVFTQVPEFMMAISRYPWSSVCFRFSGLGNPVATSRYRWARRWGQVYERFLFRSLGGVDCILATADQQAIGEVVERSNGLLDASRIVPFPTRVDTSVFKPESQVVARGRIGLGDVDGAVILYCGRLNCVKGWDLVLQGFVRAYRRRPSLRLVYVGDGEDRQGLEAMIERERMQDAVLLAGNQPRDRVVDYLNASDVLAVGSLYEGWSNTMLEALACGKPIVSTSVSGVNDLIEVGRNGYVVAGRDPEEFGTALLQAIDLEDAKTCSLGKARRYSVETLAEDLGSVWPAIRGKHSGAAADACRCRCECQT